DRLRADPAREPARIPGLGCCWIVRRYLALSLTERRLALASSRSAGPWTHGVVRPDRWRVLRHRDPVHPDRRHRVARERHADLAGRGSPCRGSRLARRQGHVAPKQIVLTGPNRNRQVYTGWRPLRGARP